MLFCRQIDNTFFKKSSFDFIFSWKSHEENSVAINFTGDKGFQILLLLSDRMLLKIEQILSVGVGVPSAGPVV